MAIDGSIGADSITRGVVPSVCLSCSLFYNALDLS